MAKRFADGYSRTHTSFAWKSPFVDEGRKGPEVAQGPRNQRPYDPRLDDLVQQLRRPQPYDHQRRRLEQKMQYDLQLLQSILGPNCRIEARSRDYNNPEYYIHIDSRSLREILWYAAGNTTPGRVSHTLQEFDDGRFILSMPAPKKTLIFTPYRENTYIITIK